MKRKTVQKAGAVSAAVIYDIRIFVRDGKGKTESKTLQLTVTKWQERSEEKRWYTLFEISIFFGETALSADFLGKL